MGKYNWIQVREMYDEMSNAHCADMYDTEFTFNSLQKSGQYAE